MLLKDKVAVIYGAGGHIGGAVACAFARDGAEVFLTGRHRDKVERVAADIAAAGGKAHVAEVDATDKAAIEQHLADLIAQTGQLDISFNAISVFGHLQGTPMVEMLSISSRGLRHWLLTGSRQAVPGVAPKPQFRFAELRQFA